MILVKDARLPVFHASPVSQVDNNTPYILINVSTSFPFVDELGEQRCFDRLGKTAQQNAKCTKEMFFIYYYASVIKLMGYGTNIMTIFAMSTTL